MKILGGFTFIRNWRFSNFVNFWFLLQILCIAAATQRSHQKSCRRQSLALLKFSWGKWTREALFQQFCTISIWASESVKLSLKLICQARFHVLGGLVHFVNLIKNCKHIQSNGQHFTWMDRMKTFYSRYNFEIGEVSAQLYCAIKRVSSFSLVNFKSNQRTVKYISSCISSSCLIYQVEKGRGQLLRIEYLIYKHMLLFKKLLE